MEEPTSSLSPEDEAIIKQFLNTDLGELSYKDLSDGSLIVAGPGGGPEVVLGCTQGTLYVSAGVATGVLATVFAASGVVAAGEGVMAIAPVSVPIYATECKLGGKKCGNMTGRYKNAFCNPLNRKRDQLGINIHQNAICDLGDLKCADIVEITRLAEGCWKGRHAVTQRCFNG